MKKYTEDDLKHFTVDGGGWLICPSGDYSQINGFGEQCSFGEWCSFGEQCSHEGLTNSRYVAVDRIGREQRKAYFFAADEGLFVRAGCFFGTADEFRKKVKETHKGTRYEREYLLALELAEIMLKEDED
ncbi:hypothetical protein F1904_11635 [Akkermansia muciniphila]|uniref:hypothetical protein n=1 Tax=Akkermansia muciniphila TaxID=239935 RepID=UPI00122F8573|nr:hypothetical protein F1904_11635 [Akkermansia muciniphila]